ERGERVSVEQFLEETAGAAALVVPVAVRARRIRVVAAVVGPGAVRVVGRVLLVTGRRGRGRARTVRCVRRRSRRVVRGLGRGDLLELPSVQEDALAAFALLDVH